VDRDFKSVKNMTVTPVYFVVSQRRWCVGNVECGSVDREGSLECVGTLKN